MTSAGNMDYISPHSNVIGTPHLNVINEEEERDNARTSVSGKSGSHQWEDSSVGSLDCYQNNYKLVSIKRVLAEGWLYKKGSGQDMLSSTAWKVRWAKLTLAEMKDHEIELPTLLIYWYPFSSQPSIFIPLDSSVINPIVNETHARHSHCFEIAPSGYQKCGDLKKDDSVIRTFSAPLKERNEWVHATNVAIGIYEKKKARQKIDRIRAQLPPSPPRRPSVPRRRTAPRIQSNRQVLSSLDESIKAIARLNVDDVPRKAGVFTPKVAPLKAADAVYGNDTFRSYNAKNNNKLEDSNIRHDIKKPKARWKPQTHLNISNPDNSVDLSSVREMEQKDNEFRSAPALNIAFPVHMPSDTCSKGSVSTTKSANRNVTTVESDVSTPYSISTPSVSSQTNTSTRGSSSRNLEQVEDELSTPVPIRATSSIYNPGRSLKKVKSFYNQRKDKGIIKVSPNAVTGLSRRVQSLPVKRVSNLRRDSSKNAIRD